MTQERAFQIAKDYLHAKLGLDGKNLRFKPGDQTFRCTVILESEGRNFEVMMATYGNQIRLTEHLYEETFYSFVKPETGAERKRRLESEKKQQERKPWAVRLRNGRIKYFDTNEEMVRYGDSHPMKAMGATHLILKK